MTSQELSISALKNLISSLNLTLKELEEGLPIDKVADHISSSTKDTLAFLSKMNNKNFSLVENGPSSEDATSYSMFPITDELSWKYYCLLEAQSWSAKELVFSSDKHDFNTMPERYREIFYDIFGFFAPGDGLVSMNILRFLQEAETYAEMMFFIKQLDNEATHAESYGMSIISLVPDLKVQNRIFSMINDLSCMKAKADLMKKYISSDQSKSVRFLASACSEGIFFQALFAMVFVFKSKGLLKNFMFLNEQVSKDETLHWNFYMDKVKQYGLPDHEETVKIIKEFVECEILLAEYILRKPIDSVEADAEAGMTLKNVSDFIRMLGDHTAVGLGLKPIYGVIANLPHMDGISMGRRKNFYEVKVGSYVKCSIADSIDWKKRAGLTEEIENSVAMPDEVDF